MKPAKVVLGNVDSPASRLALLQGVPVELLQAAQGTGIHGQECSSLWLLLRGSAVLDVGGAQVALPPRRLCVVRDATVRVHAQGRVSLLGLALPSAQIDDALRGRPGTAITRRRMLLPEAGIAAGSLFGELRRQVLVSAEAGPPPDLERWIDNLLLGLAIEQQQRFASLLERSPGRTQFDRSRSLRRLLLARSVLQMEGGERVPVARLAELACYSPSQFVRTFNTVFRSTPGELRQQLRLLRAKSLLAKTRLSVDEVAAEVGYENRSAFARMFRAGTGMSASQYRVARTPACTEFAPRARTMSASQLAIP